MESDSLFADSPDDSHDFSFFIAQNTDKICKKCVQKRQNGDFMQKKCTFLW